MFKLLPIIIASLFCFSSFAKDKKVARKPSSTMEMNINKIKAQKNCDDATRMAIKLGSADTKGVQYASAAIEICNSEFESSLKPEDQILRETLNKKCVEHYSAMGTMYQSFAAYCKLRVAGVFSSLYSQE